MEVYVSMWTVKEPGLDPMTCARHGWRNIAVDSLECGHCHARLSLPSVTNDSSSHLGIGIFHVSQVRMDSEHFVVEPLKKQLMEVHHDTCPWRDRWCQGIRLLARMISGKTRMLVESLYRFPRSSRRDTLDALRDRLASFNPAITADSIPAISIEMVDASIF